MEQLQCFFIFFFHLLYAWLYLFRPGLHSQAFTIFTFCQEKHTFSSVINSCYWRLLFKGWHAAEEGTCSGRLRPGSQASGDRGPAAEHRHIARAPARYLKGLCVIHYFLNFKLHGIHHVQHLLFFYVFFFFILKEVLWFMVQIIYFWNWGAGRRRDDRSYVELLAIGCSLTDYMVNHLHCVTLDYFILAKRVATW